MSQPSFARQAANACTLVAIAGCFDVTAYLHLSRVFVGNLTGNTVRVGLFWGWGQGGEVLRWVWPILAFMLGGWIGAVVIELSRRAKVRRRLAVAIGLELLLMVAFTVLAVIWPGIDLVRGERYFLVIALGGLAMGIQNVLVIASGTTPRVFTTHITGNLTDFSHQSVLAAIWLWDRLHERTPGGWKELTRQHFARRGALLFLLLWVFLFAVLLGTALESRFGTRALWIPVGTLGVVWFAELVMPVDAPA